MSIAGILGSSISSASFSSASSRQSLFQQRRADFQQLSQALQSGDLSGAQQAFNALSTLQSSGRSRGQNNSQLSQDFSAIGQALQSGNLAGAQQAFSNFQQDLPEARGQHHHASGGQAASSGTTPEIILNLPAPSASGSPEQITIDFSNGANGEQINLSVANGSGNPEQVTFNLSAGSSLPEIVLNFGAASAQSSAASTGSQVNVTA